MLQETVDQKILKQQVGPHYQRSGRIVVPARDDEPQAAAEFWRQQGFSRIKQNSDWSRSVREPHKGKVYTVRGWLEATRRKYADLYPDWEPPTPRQEAELMFAQAGGTLRANKFFTYYDHDPKSERIMYVRLCKEYNLSDHTLKQALKGVVHDAFKAIKEHHTERETLLRKVYSLCMG